MWEKTLSPKTWVEIDASALRHNLSVFQKLVGPQTAVMAVVKANAYGHGLPEIVSILASSFQLPASSLWFGVDSIDEALLIRDLNVKNKILVLGYIPPKRLQEVIANDISFSVYSKELLETIAKNRWVRLAARQARLDSARQARLDSARQAKKPQMHIKIETGTNRLGMRFEELANVAPLLKKHADWIEGIYTHFADTENPQSFFWKEQRARFKEAIALLEKIGVQPMRHAASSAAALLYPEARYDMARVGIGLYGLSPLVHMRPSGSHALKPVLTWRTKIAQIKKVQKGETVGYDRAFKALDDMTIAILPVGYWDGYDRRFSNNGEVLVEGTRARVAGRVCMNMTMIDITDVKNAREGDEVVLLGKQKKEEITAEESAEKIGTINYEVVARINPCIPRRVIHEEKKEKI